MKVGFIFLLLFALLFNQPRVRADDDDRAEAEQTTTSGPTTTRRFTDRDKDDSFTVGSMLEERARIIMVDGNVFFYSGSKKNISFVANPGGSIYFGAVDIKQLPNKIQIERLNTLLSSNSNLMTNLHSSVSATERQMPQIRREIVGIKLRQNNLFALIRQLNDTRTRNRNQRRVRQMIASLNGRVDKLYKLMKQDDCLTAPCKNGATCIDLFGGYKCLCPNHFVGKHCQDREDECKMYSGTHAGCQNNATCTNNQNVTGFTCKCKDGWHGPLCQYEQSTCNKENMCGENGQCIDVKKGDKFSYDCICNWGFRKTADPLNPSCIDIDECANSPCFLGSSCLNLPGSFKCESCPAGYVGNGVTCNDFDECASRLTNDCSEDPEVECVNTIGSYKCGACPEDYTGDGFKCERLKFCDSDPCIPTATCLEHEMACMCPANYAGDGFKTGTKCDYMYFSCSLTCQNGGTCRVIHSKITGEAMTKCFCPAGFHGVQCQFKDLCAQSNYCNGHGNCTRSGNTARCECFDGFYDERCQTSEAPGCSFHTSNETGVVEFQPTFEATSPAYRSPACAWVINLRDTRKVVELWFDYFEQDNSNTTTCENRDSLIIFDTNTKPIDLIADLCTDEQLPRNTTPIYSSSNSLNINYFFVNTANKSRVKMNWKAVEPVCGGRLIEQSGVFEYTSSRAYEHCTWYISVKAGYYLEVTVESMVMIGDLRNCSINKVELYDDSFIGQEPSRVMQLCQTDPKKSVRRLSGRNAVVRLSLDSYNATDEQLDKCRMQTGAQNNTDTKPKCKVYMRVSYKSIELPDKCGGEIQLLNQQNMEDSVGYLESPNYGHSYFPSLNCLWSLDASNAFNNSLLQDYGMIRLEFEELDVDSDGGGKGLFGDTTCPGDYIKLSTNPGERFCNAYPAKIYYAKERVQIEFVTTDQSRYKSRGTGFRIKYQTMCYQELKSENGTIQSPNYRFPSSIPFKCHYHIASSPSAVLKIGFDYIGLKPFTVSCIHPRLAGNLTDDYVEFSGGHSTNFMVNRRYYCSRYPFSAPNGEFVTSGGNGLSFTYSTSGDKDNTGFLFHYTTEHIGCGGYSFGMSGRIKSPGYPGIYPVGMYCIYNIILFKPGDFGIHQTHGIRLTFDAFDLENTANRVDCNFDSVRVYENYRNETDHGKLLGRFCGVKIPPPVLTEDSTMAVVFLTDRSVSGTGFSAHWEGVDLAKDCNRVFSEPSGVITFNSKDFERVTSCEYLISLSTMNRIELFIENVTLPCDEGRIMFKNGGDENSPAFSDLYEDSQMCNGKVVSRLQSQGNQVFIRLNIVNVQHASFRIRYEQLSAGCGGYMSGFAGALSAPQYPQLDSRMLSCEWKIAVALGNQVRLQFLKIDNLDSADRSGICAPFARNFIDVTTDSSPDATVLKRYCRSETAPEIIDSETNQLFVRYGQNGGSVSGGLYGFLAEYKTNCYDVELTDTHGSIQSPGFPYSITESRNCKWRIRTTPGSYLKVTFHNFNVHDTVYQRLGIDRLECMNNFLKVDPDQVNRTTGTSMSKAYNDLKVYQFCSRIAEPSIIYSKSNEMTIWFQSTNKPENHFWLSWSTIGCGGTILRNETSISAIESQFVPINISRQRECLWVAKAPLGYVVQIEIERLFTIGVIHEDQTTNCDPNAFSGLEFFNGDKPTHNYTQQELCGVVTNKQLKSYSNEMTVRLRTDGTMTNAVNGLIFEGKVLFVKPPLGKSCGGIVYIIPGTNDTIRSPNYPNAYPRGVECVWQIETRKGYTVAFNLSRFDTPNQHAKRQVGHLTRPMQNNRCNYVLGFIEGNIAFYALAYNRTQFDSIYGVSRHGAIQRICVDITEPIIIQTMSNTSTVIFNGAPYEASVPSGDTKSSTPVGFQLEVYSICGGTLQAGKERRTFQLNGLFMEKQSAECKLRIERDEDADLAAPIYARFELQAKNLRAMNGTEIMIKYTCGSTTNDLIVMHTEDVESSHEVREVKCDTPLTVVVQPFSAGKSLVVSYDTEAKFCGGQMHSVKGVVNMGKLKTDIECEWNFDMFDGNNVEIQIAPSYLERTPHCSQSYVELRSDNKSGPVIGRRCGQIDPFTVQATRIYMRLRQVLDKPDNDGDSDETSEEERALGRLDGEPRFAFSFKYKLGGYTSSKRIVMFWRSTDYIDLTNPENARVSWMLTAKNTSNYIRIHITNKFNVDIVFLDYHCPSPCSNPLLPNAIIKLEEEKLDLKDKVYLIKSNVASILATRITTSSALLIEWDEVSIDVVNQTLAREEAVRESVFDCGGELIATYPTQNFTLPTNEKGEYDELMRCRWKIKRTMLTSLIFTINKLDLEEHADCLYDYLMVTSKEYNTLEELSESPFNKYCHKTQINQELLINYDEYAYIYFVSDASSSYTGFTLNYRLGCRTFEYISAAYGLLDMVFESPMFPDTYKYNYSCMWGMMLESNRDVTVTSNEMDLAPRVNGACSVETLTIGDFPSPMDPSRRSSDFCGNETVNFTASGGRIYIQLEKPMSKEIRKGFRLHIREIVHGCSSQALYVDEHTKSAVLTSPNFPHLAPNSLDCRWTLSVPAGHRLKFTVDPNTFNLQNSGDECTDDFIEVYDGASEGAPFLGRYCGTQPPSTIVSTDSHLFVRFSTDYYAQSAGWNATYELASCGGTVNLVPKQNTSITSPNYPDVYPSKEQCEWTVRPPKGHFVHAKLNHLWLYYTDNCTHDFLTLRETNSTGPLIMPQTCTYRNVNSSGYYLTGDAHLFFQSNTTGTRYTRNYCLNKKCGFDMEFGVSEFECGGLITDEEGEHYLQTNRANKIVPGLRCKYDFRAGIGFRYKIEFFFLEQDQDTHGYYYRTNLYTSTTPTSWCFPDLEVWNGLQENRYNLFGTHQRFCRNQTTFVSTSDIMSMAYEDRSELYNFYFMLNQSLLHIPFGFRYTKVEADYDEYACMYHITEDMNITIRNLTQGIKSTWSTDSSVIGQTKSFCHIRVDNPLRFSTVSLNFTDFRAGRQNAHVCSSMDNKVVITDTGTAKWPIKELLCTATVKNESAYLVYNHPLLDIYVQNNPFTYMYGFDGTVQFNLSVVFHACGGYITEDENGNSGTITSPGWNRGNYTNSADCLWTFEAPEGKVVQVNFTYMDIEYHVGCAMDVLEVSEGEDRHAVIGRYCYGYGNGAQELPERFRMVKSHGRYLTMYFHTDEADTRKGFSANWEFTSFENGTCGFTSHARTGVIHTPNYPDADYPNNLRCMWFIVVPQGFHIRLTFDHIDIQESVNCVKDVLSISQEHQSRDQDPLNTYYFYYDHEEILNKTCGVVTPPPIVSESNQMRINFTTDAKITGKGFKIKWQAECGTVFTTSHGVVTSPFYPNYYPNENFECNYLINPDTESEKIVTVRLVDADLDTTFSALSFTSDCSSDFVEVFDVTQKVTLIKFCGRDQLQLTDSNSVFSVRGAVGVRFVSNMSMLHDYQRNRKNHRGFKLTYALSECGGELNLAEAHNRLAGTISSPGYPMPYHEDLECVWNITAPEGYVIAIKFTGLEMELSTNCSFDFVEVYDGSQMLNETSFGRLCGRRAPEGHKTTTKNSAIVRFVSDSSSNSAGFMAVLTATVGPDKGCGGNFIARPESSKLIVPFDTNTNTYLNNLRCLWKIRTNSTRIVEIKLTVFEMEKHYRANNLSECYDFLAIYDGPSSISPFLLKPTCELPRDMLNLPVYFYSSFHTAEIYFESDHSDSFTGFELEYKAVEEDCGGIYKSFVESSEIIYESRKTPTRTNQRQKRCRFFIKGTKNEPIELQFVQFNFPSTTNDCTDEYLEIRDVGTIAECEHPACAKEQSDVSASVRVCGNNIPHRFVSRTSLVQIVTSATLQSQYSVSFSVRHNLLDSCNRTITIQTGAERWASGRISSPNYPNNYDDNATCFTRISAPKDKQILLVFQHFSLERSSVRSAQQHLTASQQRYGLYRVVVSNCEYDNLTVYFNESVPTVNETYCGWSSPPTRFTPNNTVSLKLVTDGSYGLAGYNAFYYTTTVIEDSPMHKFYNFAPIYEPEGYLTNIGYPGYTQNTTQRWTVIPPSGMTCAVKIITYMSRTRICNPNEKAKWAHYTGNSPDRWIDLPCFDPFPRDSYNLTAGEKMMFEMTTDGYTYNNGLGFRVFWACINAGTPIFMVDDWEQGNT